MPPDVSSLSDLYKKGARLLLRNGLEHFVTDGVMLSDLRELLLEIIERLDKLEAKLSDKGAGKNGGNGFDLFSAVKILLSDDRVFEATSVSELESFYPVMEWKNHTEEILAYLVNLGKLKVLSGDKILWL